MKPLVCLAVLALATAAVAQQPQPEPKPTPGISVIHFVAPKYPALAKTARISGDVRLLVEVAPDGSAKAVTVISGHPMLVQAATEVVKQWRFGCQRCDLGMRHVVTVSFQIFDDLAGPCGGTSQPVGCVEPQLPELVIIRSGPVSISGDWGRQVKVRSHRCLWLWRCLTLVEPD